VSEYDREASAMRMSWPTRFCRAMEKEKCRFPSPVYRPSVLLAMLLYDCQRKHRIIISGFRFGYMYVGSHELVPLLCKGMEILIQKWDFYVVCTVHCGTSIIIRTK
jgi:hypothetical protein